MFSYRNNNLQPMLVTNDRRSDNSSVILFTNARDEPNISEWISHHLLLGFDKIIVFDHLSITPISSTIHTNFNGRLDIIKVGGVGNIKLKLMEKAANIARNGNYSWMLYLDADEFLNLNKFTNIKQPKGLITENFIRSEMRLDKHVKSFVRPSTVVKVVNPHYYIISNSRRYYSANGTKMGMRPFNEQPLPFIKAYAYIAHFYTQSEEEHLRRKSRVMDDGTSNKASGLQEVHNIYNNVVNNQLQNKYSQKTKSFLKEHNIVL